MKRWRIWAAVAFVCLIAAGCGKKYEKVDVTADLATEPATTTAPETTTVPETTTAEETGPAERDEIDGKIRSYLTGEMVPVSIGNRRPVAIMMSNDKQACPQSGINYAGVIYEAPVEGGMNRYMGVFEDYDNLDKIGVLRSCRTYYTYFAREFEAIYAHYGQSTFAKPYLKNVDNLNGVEGIGETVYYRTTDRKKPHNAYTSYKGLQAGIEKKGYSQEYPDTYKGHFLFVRDGKKASLVNPVDCYKVVPGYVYNKPWFEYNEEDGLYYRYQYDAPHKDDQGQQIAVKNIIIQYCEYGHYATTEYLDINVHGAAHPIGKYITDGKAVDVTWEKDGEFGPTRFYDENGKEIVFNQGRTWICIVGADRIEKTEIYGK